MAVSRAATEYHDALSDELGAETQSALDAQLRKRGLFFGDRPLCTVLRPRFLQAREYRLLQQQCALLLSAFRCAYDAAMKDPKLRAQFGLAPWEEELLAVDPGFADPSPTSRLDAFWDGSPDGLWFTEYNAETPAGIAYGDTLSEVFLGLPAMGTFLRRWDVRALPARPGLLHPLLDAFRQWRGSRETPRVVILDWREVPTYSEFVLVERYLTELGMPCTIADPRDAEYRGGRLLFGDFHATLIYKRVLLSELVERGGIDHPVIRAVRERAVCMVNPFRCKLLHKKASLSVLSDECHSELFTPEQRRAIAAHIPWTRNVAERRTTYGGETIDLVPWAARNRERLVLKPNDEYGGKGIVLGWEVDDGVWESALRTALAEPSIVQERIPIPTEPYPSLVSGRVELFDRMLDTAPFVSYGTLVDGCMTRLSTASLLNVTAGGGSTVPVFIAEPRS